MNLVFSLLLVLISSLCFAELHDHLRILNDKTEVVTIRNVDYMYVINLDHRKTKYQLTLEEFAPYGILPYRFSAVNGWKLPIETLWDVSLVFQKGMRSGGMGTVYRIDPVNGKEYASHEVVEVEGTSYLCHCSARGMIGCILSHLTVIKDALNSGYEIIWICEDDVEVVKNPHILSDYIDQLDLLEGRENWDVLFTFRDYRGPGGQYYTPYGANYRPNIETRCQEKFNINRPISSDLRQAGSRFGTQSMIWTKRGMEKILRYYENYKIFMPYDLDIVLVPDIRIYSVMEDVVTNKLDVQSDLGSSEGI
jgi:GR25 family glycosyltransferase involved in LPS biosynthesis